MLDYGLVVLSRRKSLGRSIRQSLLTPYISPRKRDEQGGSSASSHWLDSSVHPIEKIGELGFFV